jgi:hypothetical protein
MFHLQWIMYVIIALYLIVCGYIRIKMHFWHTQPVFHIYNLKYWLRPPGIILRDPPPVNKFVNLSNNELIRIDDISGNSYKPICQFISDNYVNHDTASYRPTEEDILAYLQCSNQSAYFNVYKDTKMAFIPDQEMLGVISARLLNVTLTKNKSQPLTFPVYYIDNLCVKDGHRKKGIAPELIQTFHYTISRANPKVNAYLFKREGQLNAIVPLVCYDTYLFDMTHYRGETLLTASMTVIEVGSQNFNLFIAFVKDQMTNFDCVILPDVSNVLNLLKLGKLKIYGILFQGELISIYAFRVLNLSYGGKKATECITILSRDVNQSDIIIAGFNMCWHNISRATQCSIVLLEETAHSHAVRKELMKDQKVGYMFKSPTAFFLYNYATYSVANKKALLFY